MTRDPRPLSALGKIARLFTYAGFVYWGLYVLVAPVTNVDSQMYNLARIELAVRGGLFGNLFFTSPYHVMWPWSFDAVHLPFLQIGFGFALPSFCCLLGVSCVVFTMIRERFGPDAGWVATLSLLGLTCLVYQATSTKNDIALVLAISVWIYGRWRWRREARGVHLGWMVLAIGFMAGAKTTGVVYGFLLGLWTLYEIHGNKRFLLRVCGGLAAAGILLGSVETYIESARTFGHILGSTVIVEPLRNNDGLRGALANISRYLVGGIYVGPTSVGPSGSTSSLVLFERELLSRAGLRDAGTEPKYPDDRLFFPQCGFEELSGFGPLGTFAITIMLVATLLWKPRSLWWQIAAAGFLGIVIISFLASYTQWSNRYLIGSYALATVACVCFLWEREARWRQALRWLFAFVAASSAVAAPLLSFNRGPSAIIQSLFDREHFETCVSPLIGKVRERLRVLKNHTPHSRVYFVVGRDSLVLPYLRDPELDLEILTPPIFAHLVASGGVRPGDLVIEDHETNTPSFIKIEEVWAPNMFSKGNMCSQIIYRMGETTVKY